MKNIVKSIVCVAMVGLLMWAVWSWHNVITTNTATDNREVSKYNLFYLLVSTEPVEEYREEVATIYAKDNGTLTFRTMDDGNLWELRVNDVNDWNAEHYVVIFNTRHTKDLTDDRIVGVHQLEALATADRGN